MRISTGPVPDDVDAALVGRVQLEDSVFERRAEQVSSKTEDGRRFADARRTGDDDVRDVAIAGEDGKARNGVLVANDLLRSRKIIEATVIGKTGCLHMGIKTRAQLSWLKVSIRRLIAIRRFNCIRYHC